MKRTELAGVPVVTGKLSAWLNELAGRLGRSSCVPTCPATVVRIVGQRVRRIITHLLGRWRMFGLGHDPMLIRLAPTLFPTLCHLPTLTLFVRGQRGDYRPPLPRKLIGDSVAGGWFRCRRGLAQGVRQPRIRFDRNRHAGGDELLALVEELRAL